MGFSGTRKMILQQLAFSRLNHPGLAAVAGGSEEPVSWAWDGCRGTGVRGGISRLRPGSRILWLQMEIREFQEALPIVLFDGMPTVPEVVADLAFYEGFAYGRRAFFHQERLLA